MQFDLHFFRRFESEGFLEKRLIFEGNGPSAQTGSDVRQGETVSEPLETGKEAMPGDLDIKKYQYADKFQQLDDKVQSFKNSPNATIQLAAKQAETKMQSMKPEKARALDEKGVDFWLGEITKVTTYFEQYPAFDVKKRQFETKSSEWVVTMTESLKGEMENQLAAIKAKYPNLKGDALFSLKQIADAMPQQIAGRVELAKSVIFKDTKGQELMFQDYLANPGKLAAYTDETMHELLGKGIEMFDIKNETEFQKGFEDQLDRFETEMEAVVVQYEANSYDSSKNYVELNAKKMTDLLASVNVPGREGMLKQINDTKQQTLGALEMVRFSGEDAMKTRAVLLGNFMDQMNSIQDRVLAKGDQVPPRESRVGSVAARRVHYEGDLVTKGFEKGVMVSGGFDRYSDEGTEQLRTETLAAKQNEAQSRVNTLVEAYRKNPQTQGDTPEAQELYRQIALAKQKGASQARYGVKLGERATPEMIAAAEEAEVKKVVDSFVAQAKDQAKVEVESLVLARQREKMSEYYDTHMASITGGVRNVQFRGEGGISLGFLQPGEQFHVTGPQVYEVAAGKGKTESYYRVKLASGVEGYVPVKYVRMSEVVTPSAQLKKPQPKEIPVVDVRDLPNA